MPLNSTIGEGSYKGNMNSTFGATGGVGAATMGATSSTSAKKRTTFFFLNHADRLACDPSNTFHIYCLYEFKYETKLERAQQDVERVLDRALLSAAVYYTNARDLFCNSDDTSSSGDNADPSVPVLPAPLKRRLVLRGVTSSVVALLASGYSGGGGGRGGRNSRSGSTSAVNSRRGSTTNTPGITPRKRRSSSRAAADDVAEGSAVTPDPASLEDKLYQLLLREWPTRESQATTATGSETAPPSTNRLNVNVYFDIVASRKSLGAQPTMSAPYLAGQHIHQYLQDGFNSSRRAAAAGVRVNPVIVHVGITDSDSRFVCRDVLVPFRSAPAGATAPTSLGHTFDGNGTFGATAEASIFSGSILGLTDASGGGVHAHVGGGGAAAAAALQSYGSLSGSIGGFSPALTGAVSANANPAEGLRMLQPYHNFLYNTKRGTAAVATAGKVIPMILAPTAVQAPQGPERIDQSRLLLCFPAQHPRKKKKEKR